MEKVTRERNTLHCSTRNNSLDFRRKLLDEILCHVLHSTTELDVGAGGGFDTYVEQRRDRRSTGPHSIGLSVQLLCSSANKATVNRGSFPRQKFLCGEFSKVLE